MKSTTSLQKTVCKSKLFLRKYAPTILSCIGASGVVITTILAVKATPKAIELLENRKTENKNEELTKLDIIQTVGSLYLPSIIIGLSTIACIFGANTFNKKQQAAIASAYILLNNTYSEYKNKAEELYGEGCENQIRSAILNDKYNKDDFSISAEKCLFYEENLGEYFERTKEEVLLAEYHFNRNFALRGYASLNEFYSFLGLKPIEHGEILGWSLYAGEMFYGYSWVDFEHQFVEMEDGLECYIITMPFPPTLGYIDC